MNERGILTVFSTEGLINLFFRLSKIRKAIKILDNPNLKLEESINW